MSHTCPTCGLNCHCGGDIDDCCFSDTDEEMNCTHCPDDYFEGDEDDLEHITWCVLCGASPCDCAESI